MYLDEEKFFLVAVQKPVTMLMQTDKMEIEIITEILSDQHEPKEVNQKINTFAKTRLKSNSVDERIFLDALVNYDPKKST